MHIDVPRVALGDVGVVVRRDPDEDRRVAAAEGNRRNPRVFERLPRRLEEPALLGVHAQGFARRDPEKLGVEAVEIADEPAPLRDHLPRNVHVFVVPPFTIPAIRRHRHDPRAPLHHHLPEGLRAVHTAGKPAADTNNGQGFVGRLGGVGHGDKLSGK